MKSVARIRGEETLLKMGEELKLWDVQDFYHTDHVDTALKACRFYLEHPDERRGNLCTLKFWEKQLMDPGLCS